MGIISFIVAGLIIGALARLIKPGKQSLGLVMTMVVGIVGSFIGGAIAVLLGSGDYGELNVIGFIAAVIAAVLLLGAVEALMRKRG